MKWQSRWSRTGKNGPDATPAPSWYCRRLCNVAERRTTRRCGSNFADEGALQKALRYLSEKKLLRSQTSLSRRAGDKVEKIAELAVSPEEALAFAAKRRKDRAAAKCGAGTAGCFRQCQQQGYLLFYRCNAGGAAPVGGVGLSDFAGAAGAAAAGIGTGGPGAAAGVDTTATGSL